MKMRELERSTGVNRETIRVWLREGLIPAPSRPKPNVADYDETHVRAIKAVRNLQRENNMTLREIREALHGGRRAARTEPTAFPHLEALLSTRVGIDVAPILLSSLARAYPHAEADAKALAGIGIIEIMKSPKGRALSITDTRLVAIWGEMRQAGFNEKFGFTPEMLSFYIKPAHIVADNEARLFLERVEGLISEERAAELLQTGLKQMQDFWGLIRLKRLLGNLERIRVRQGSKGQKSASRSRQSSKSG